MTMSDAGDAATADSDVPDAGRAPRGRRVRQHDGSSEDALGAIDESDGAPAPKRASKGRAKRATEALKEGTAEPGSDPAVGGIAVDRLRSIVERIERLEEEKKAIGNDIKDIVAEAKSAGFDTKVIRSIIAIRKQEPAEVEEQETLLDVYKRALGM